jgi:hypothetical protein
MFHDVGDSFVSQGFADGIATRLVRFSIRSVDNSRAHISDRLLFHPYYLRTGWLFEQQLDFAVIQAEADHEAIWEPFKSVAISFQVHKGAIG